MTVTDRMNYVSPMANNVAWHHAVETLLGIEVTPRCKYMRCIVAELARISDHLLCVGGEGEMKRLIIQRRIDPCTLEIHDQL